MAKNPKTPNPGGKRPKAGQPGSSGFHNGSNWNYKEAKQRQKILDQQFARSKKRMKAEQKYGNPKDRARRERIAATTANLTQLGSTITGNVLGVEAEQTERARIAADATVKYANLINAAQGQTGNADTGANDDTGNPKPNNQSNPGGTGGPNGFGW